MSRAIRSLPYRQRAVVVLRYYADLTEREVAVALGCSVGTVKSQSHRALNRLRNLVPRQHSGPMNRQFEGRTGGVWG